MYNKIQKDNIFNQYKSGIFFNIKKYFFIYTFVIFSSLDIWKNLHVAPLFPLILIFYYSLFLSSLHIVDILIMGILCDVILTNELGYYTTLFLITSSLIHTTRKYIFSFSYLLGVLGFGLLVAIAMFIETILLSYHDLEYIFSSLCKGHLALVMSYPFMRRILEKSFP
jgi:cell shape-determining protein MreD